MLLIGAAMSACAELTITEGTIAPEIPHTGSHLTFTATVANKGRRTSTPCKLEFRVGGETDGEMMDIPELSPGEEHVVQRRVLLDVAQNYRNTITVDVEGDVREFDEGNNVYLQNYTVQPAINVGVYYYPWHHHDFHGRQYLREHLVPQQVPTLGEYDDRDPAVIAQHLSWCEEAGIDFWVASWWGPGSVEDVTLRDHILGHPSLGDMKIALFYETQGRTNNYTDYSNLYPDMLQIAANYFDHPNYLRVNGRPVLFVYLTRVLSGRGTLLNTVNALRSASQRLGYNVYIVGDEVFGSPPSGPGSMNLLDAVTNYDVYGSMGRTGYATSDGVRSYFDNQRGWRDIATAAGVSFIPSTTPGFNDRGVRGGHAPTSRKLSSTAAYGTLFEAMIRGAADLVDEDANNMIMITSWNEWHEDTQIEPVQTASPTSAHDSYMGRDLTEGLSYEGYGTRYLEILEDLLGN